MIKTKGILLHVNKKIYIKIVIKIIYTNNCGKLLVIKLNVPLKLKEVRILFLGSLSRGLSWFSCVVKYIQCIN